MSDERRGGWWPAIGAGSAVVVLFVAGLPIPLAAAEIGLTKAEVTAWILVHYGFAGAVTLALVARYRMPMLATGNIFILIFVISLGRDLRWAELVGASLVAGALVLLLGLFGLTDRLAAWLPAPIAFGLLAGAVLPFFVDLFTALGEEQVVVGGMLAAYVVGYLVFGPQGPTILPALVVGAALAALTGQLGPAPELVAPIPELTAPEFSPAAIITATPVFVVLMTLQANVPSVVFLRDQGYAPPERTMTAVSGAGTLAGSSLGPLGISLSLPATALAAGPHAGERSVRHRAAVIGACGLVVIGLLAGVAAELVEVVPKTFLQGAVGLAVIGLLTMALERIATGPLRLGPLFAFGIALSDLELFGLGPFFWALAGGLLVSLLLEREGWRALGAE